MEAMLPLHLEVSEAHLWIFTRFATSASTSATPPSSSAPASTTGQERPAMLHHAERLHSLVTDDAGRQGLLWYGALTLLPLQLHIP